MKCNIDPKLRFLTKNLYVSIYKNGSTNTSINTYTNKKNNIITIAFLYEKIQNDTFTKVLVGFAGDKKGLKYKIIEKTVLKYFKKHILQ